MLRENSLISIIEKINVKDAELVEGNFIVSTNYKIRVSLRISFDSVVLLRDHKSK